jgi:hypothetical protein
MPIALPLKKLSRDEKLRAMEALWADLSQDEARFESAVWHDHALREAERAVKTGKARFSDLGGSKKTDSLQGSEACVTLRKFRNALLRTSTNPLGC